MQLERLWLAPLVKGSRCAPSWQTKLSLLLQLHLYSTSYRNSTNVSSWRVHHRKDFYSSLEPHGPLGPVPHSADYNNTVSSIWHTAAQQGMVVAVAICCHWALSYKTPRLHRNSDLICMLENLLCLIIKYRINQNTKNNSNNSNSERPKASLVVRMVESHGTQHYLHYISERSVILYMLSKGSGGNLYCKRILLLSRKSEVWNYSHRHHLHGNVSD